MDTRFPYILSNLGLYTPDIIGIILWMISLLIFGIICYFALLYTEWLKILIKEKNTIDNKKKVLGDLILMKDIQTELESEIEQSMLKSTFQ